LTPIFGVIFRPSRTRKIAIFRSPDPTPDPTPGSGSRGAIFRGFRGFRRKTRPKPRIRPKTGISGPDPKNRSPGQKSGPRAKIGGFPENPPRTAQKPDFGLNPGSPPGKPKNRSRWQFSGFPGVPAENPPQTRDPAKTRISGSDLQIGFPPKPGPRPKNRVP